MYYEFSKFQLLAYIISKYIAEESVYQFEVMPVRYWSTNVELVKIKISKNYFHTLAQNCELFRRSLAESTFVKMNRKDLLSRKIRHWSVV